MSPMRRCLWIAFCVLLVPIGFQGEVKAQDRGGLESYFTGKEVTVKLDLPGSQRGVDVNVDKAPPLNWNDYGKRVKEYGVAIPKGSTSRVTAFVLKKDRIEFQLDGGGFGTFGDDSSTTVASKRIEKSNYEKQLEADIANTDDEDRRRRLQKDLDRERDRRERQQAANDRAAQVASQMKSAQVADHRQGGGSRINLRWPGHIPEGELTPDAVIHVLSEYVDFGATTGGVAATATPGPMNTAPAVAGDGNAPATARLHNGMNQGDVNALFGGGRLVSHSTANGMQTEDVQYLTDDRQVVVTFVNGIVVRYSISSR
jgi:hypothetical protein